jgi:hypothetical protein
MFSDVVCNFLSFGNNILLKVSDSSQFWVWKCYKSNLWNRDKITVCCKDHSQINSNYSCKCNNNHHCDSSAHAYHHFHHLSLPPPPQCQQCSYIPPQWQQCPCMSQVHQLQEITLSIMWMIFSSHCIIRVHEMNFSAKFLAHKRIFHHHWHYDHKPHNKILYCEITSVSLSCLMWNVS